MGERLLSIEGLRVGFDTDDGRVQSVRGVDLTIDRGEVVAVVGESGSGKSVTALAVLGLHPKQRTVIEGCIRWHDEDLLAASEDRLREVRGGEIAMVFQDPLTALNPVHTVGRQIIEMVRSHRGGSKQAARDRAIEMLGLVGIRDAETLQQRERVFGQAGCHDASWAWLGRMDFRLPRMPSYALRGQPICSHDLMRRDHEP